MAINHRMKISPYWQLRLKEIYLHGEVVDEAFPSGRPFQKIVHLPLKRGPSSAVFFAQISVFPRRSCPLGGDQWSRIRDTFKKTKPMRSHFQQTFVVVQQQRWPSYHCRETKYISNDSNASSYVKDLYAIDLSEQN